MQVFRERRRASPGAEVAIQAGYGNAPAEIFKGIVVSQRVSISGNNESRLLVQCRDAAVRLTVGRNSAVFENQTDGDVMTRLIGACGLTADVTRTAITHKCLVQYNCTDWDFLVARAESCGYIVVVNDGTVKVGPPGVHGAPALKITYGADLIEFQADLDARDQYATVTAQAWDMASQTLLQSTAASPLSTEQGNLNRPRRAVLGAPDCVANGCALVEGRAGRLVQGPAAQVRPGTGARPREIPRQCARDTRRQYRVGRCGRAFQRPGAGDRSDA
jgi:phage protein D